MKVDGDAIERAIEAGDRAAVADALLAFREKSPPSFAPARERKRVDEAGDCRRPSFRGHGLSLAR
jgi:hypothetical protein